MKKLITVLIFVMFISATSQTPQLIVPRDHAVLLSAEVDYNDESINISWESNRLATGYIVSRRLNGEESFTSLTLNPLENTEFSYTDNSITPGLLYEYMVSAMSVGLLRENHNGKDTLMEKTFFGTGYISAGINADIKYEKGIVLLIVETDLMEYIPDKINRLRDDLRDEGWGVTIKDFPRTEEFNKDAVKDVKHYILEQISLDKNISTVFILGRIAVPYSGIIVPDGHTDHIGAWPADLYYGQIDESSWRDMSANRTTAKRPENHNVPGDGKFDLSQLPAGRDVTIAVGRVDFYNMPSFITEEANEIQLYANYLDKNHNFRTGKNEIEFRGIIDDNFKSYPESFSSGGWRNIAANVGKENVQEADFINSLKDDTYLYAYGCGGGTYISAGGIGSTSDMAANELNGVFTMLFGSYFGDWDSQDNFLRSPLATMPSVLTSVWSGRPQWYMHHMGMGFPIGYSTVLSQNNFTEYYPNLFLMNGSQEIITSGNRQIHTALMGDPTLIQYRNNEILPPLAVYVVRDAPNTFRVEWEPPETDDIKWFNIYRSFEEYGEYKRINDEPLQDTRFIDENVMDEVEIYYMVKTAQPKHTNGGSFFHESIGVIASILSDVSTADSDNSIVVGPIPTNDRLNISIYSDGLNKVRSELYDMNGSRVAVIIDDNLSAGKYDFVWNSAGRCNQGVYILRTNIGNNTYVNKVIINR